MGATNTFSILDNKELEEKLKDAEPHILIEILYEYLSGHISTHFEKTLEGINTLHDSLNARRQEHAALQHMIEQIQMRLDRLEKKLSQ